MNDQNNLLTAIGVFLSGGALATIISAITKYWLDKRKTSDDHDERTIAQFQARVRELEQEHRDCMKQNAEMAKRIGYLEASVELLKNTK